jgi:zinc D-Ala-D-Ala carboxypeptidase
MMRLSPHFTLKEMVKSQTATRLGIDNTPTEDHINNLCVLCTEILEPVRSHFGVSFSPSSGYRSEELCEAIGSSKRSQHAKGQAADFEVPGVSNYDLAAWISQNLEFDQLILEFYDPEDPNSGWVHCSVRADDDNRGQVLRYDGKSYQPGLI